MFRLRYCMTTKQQYVFSSLVLVFCFLLYCRTAVRTMQPYKLQVSR